MIHCCSVFEELGTNKCVGAKFLKSAISQGGSSEVETGDRCQVALLSVRFYLKWRPWPLGHAAVRKRLRREPFSIILAGNLPF